MARELQRKKSCWCLSRDPWPKAWPWHASAITNSISELLKNVNLVSFRNYCIATLITLCITTSHDVHTIASHDVTWCHITWHHMMSYTFIPCTPVSFWGWIWNGAVFWVPNMSGDVPVLPGAYETVELYQWMLPCERYPLWRGGDWGRRWNRTDWPRKRFAAGCC